MIQTQQATLREKLDGCFCLWMVFLALLYYIPFLMETVDILLDISCVIGVGVIGLRLLARQFQKTAYTWILLAFLGLYALTAVLHGCRLDDAKVWIYLLLAFFLFFSAPKPQQTFITGKLMYLLTVYSLLTGIVSLILFLADVTIIRGSALTTDVAVVGIHPNSSLYGLIGNSNRMSWVALFGIFASLYSMELRSWGRAKYIFYGNIVLQVVLIVLSNSRGGALGLCIFVGFYSLVRALRKYKSLPRSLAVTLLALVLTVGSCAVLKQAENLYYSHVIIPAEEASSPEQEHTSQLETAERGAEQQSRTTVARLDAYRAGIQVFLAHPLLGVGKEAVSEEMKHFLPKDSLLISYQVTGNLHCTYLAVLVCSGLLGFGLLTALVLRILLRTVKRRQQLSVKEFLLLAVLLTFLAINLFESELLYVRTFSCFLCWYFLGLLAARETEDVLPESGDAS